MTTSSFELPPQCRNCKWLQGLVGEFDQEASDYISTAEKSTAHMEAIAEKLALPVEAELSAHTVRVFGAAKLIVETLAKDVTNQVALAELVCNGTDDPSSPEPPDCNFLESVLE